MHANNRFFALIALLVTLITILTGCAAPYRDQIYS